MDEGRVQEEIRFTICTEMLVSLLVCEVMKPNECIFLIGCEQFTTYSGYANTFKAKASFTDKTPK
jgi:poly(ADP-ribose) glycohydrolase